MEYIHVRNLEKYHPGYQDRRLYWAKIYFDMVQGDPDCEMITNEVDFARLVKFIILELAARKPIPLDNIYLTKKGFDLKKRPISLTIHLLHNFLDTVTDFSKSVTHFSKVCSIDIDKDIDIDIDKDKETPFVDNPVNNSNGIYEYYSKNIKPGAKEDALKSINRLLKAGITKEELLARIDTYKAQLVKDRKEDKTYWIQANNFFGRQARYKDFEPQATKYKVADSSCKLCKGTGWVWNEARSGNELCGCRKVK
jgi:hypothetical protein